MGNAPILTVDGVSKAYGSTQALQDLSLEIMAGEVHAILGENGAGKSTLIKILSGATQPDSGAIAVASEPVRLRTPADARAAGIATAYQELTLVPQLTVAQNLWLGHEPTNRAGLATESVLAESSARLLAEWELHDVDVEDVVENLSLGVRQQVELVRALGQRPEILLLDEPTAALGAAQVDWLFRQVALVKDLGTTVIFISHRMGEVRTICDRTTVLRGGMAVGTFATGEADDDRVMTMMMGREVEKVLHREHDEKVGEPLLVLEGLCGDGSFADVDLELRSGEIVGVAALQGHGQYELFMTLFGAMKPTKGRIRVDGTEMRFRSPRHAIHAGVGISLVPEDRKVQGVMLEMSGLRNVTLPILRSLSRFGFMRTKVERQEAINIFEMVNVRLSALDDEVSTLSGGNQQKLAIGKWLRADSRCLLMYDPTRGVDVGTKAEIFELMYRLSSRGSAVLFYSTDIDELLAVGHRVLVMYRGRVVANLSGEGLTQKAVLASMLGVERTTDEQGVA